MRRILLFTTLFVFAIASALAQATYYVATNGDDTHNGSQATPWLTIQHAVNTATSGDIIYVGAGTFNEVITINKSITLIGSGHEDNPNATRINCTYGSTLDPKVSYPMLIKGDGAPLSDVTIKNFRFEGDGIIDGSESGVIMLHAGDPSAPISNVTIESNSILGTERGIFLYENVSNITIKNNILDNIVNWHTIALIGWASSSFMHDIHILNNEIKNSKANPILVMNYGKGSTSNFKNLFIDGNYIHDNDVSNHGQPGYILNREGQTAGILIRYNWDNVSITNNIVENNLDMSGIGIWGIHPAGSDITNLTIKGNILRNNTGSDRLTGDLQNIRPEYLASGISINLKILDKSTWTIENNAITNNSMGLSYYEESLGMPTEVIDAKCNWWGTRAATSLQELIKVAAKVDYSEVLESDDLINSACSTPTSNLAKIVRTGDEYPTILAAVNAAIDNDIIIVSEGIFTEAVTIPAGKALTIKGANAGIAAGNNPGTRGAETILNGGFSVKSASTIDGFTIQGGSFSGSKKNCIHVGAPNVTVKNCILKNVSVDNGGIEAQGTSNFTLENSTVTNNYRGVYLNPGSGHKLIGNLIDANNGVGVGIGSDGLSNFTMIGNTISNHTLEGWGASSVGANVVAHYNKFLNNGTSIAHYGGYDIDASCNWWGSADQSAVVSSITANVNYNPWLIDGEDDQPGVPGFQPVEPNPCSEDPVAATAVATDYYCGETDGSLLVTITSGIAPYSISWTGPSNGTADITAEPWAYNIANLEAGMYEITVTAVGSITTINAEVQHLRVHNTSDNTYYASIQAAIDAATAEDIIETCVGVYNEQLNINKAITLKGNQAGVDPRPYVGSARTPDDETTETIIQAPVSGYIVELAASDITIDGIQFRHDGVLDNKDKNGIQRYLTSTPVFENITIKNNIITHCNGDGMNIKSVNNLLITNNYLRTLKQDGICASGATENVVIKDNEIVGSNSEHGGIYIYQIEDVKIYGNLIRGSKCGIRLTRSSGSLQIKDIEVYNNEIIGAFTSGSGSAWGITLQGPASGSNYSENVNIHNNKIIQTGPTVPANFGLFIAYGNVRDVRFNENYLEMATGSRYIHFGNPSGAVNPADPIDITCNWFGSADLSDVESKIYNRSAHSYIPYLHDGTDTEPGTLGFQPTEGACLCETGTLVLNETKVKTYCSIQAAINDANDNDVIIASAGTYTEDIQINKPLTLKGANAGTACGDTRVAESIIQPASSGQTAIRITSDGVTIDGFEITAPGSNYAIHCGNGGANDLKIVNNKIHHIGVDRGSLNVYAIAFHMGNANRENITISDNCITDILSTDPKALGNSAAIWVGQSIANGIISNLLIENNKINNVHSYANNKVSIGIAIEVAWGVGTGGVDAPVIRNNEIKNIVGVNSNALAINLSAKTYNGVTVNNNFIDNAKNGVVVPDTNIGFANVTINYNSIINVDYAVINQNTGSLDATCNWYGTPHEAEIKAKIQGDVKYFPYKTNAGPDSCLEPSFKLKVKIR